MQEATARDTHYYLELCADRGFQILGISQLISLEKNINAIKQEIVALRERLSLEKAKKVWKEQYAALATQINKLPTREESLKYMNNGIVCLYLTFF